MDDLINEELYKWRSLWSTADECRAMRFENKICRKLYNLSFTENNEQGQLEQMNLLQDY